MAMHKIPAPEKFPGERPSQDTTARFPGDYLLRCHGFRILERRRGREPVWARRGERFPETEARRLALEAEASAPCDRG